MRRKLRWTEQTSCLLAHFQYSGNDVRWRSMIKILHNKGLNTLWQINIFAQSCLCRERGSDIQEARLCFLDGQSKVFTSWRALFCSERKEKPVVMWSCDLSACRSLTDQYTPRRMTNTRETDKFQLHVPNLEELCQGNNRRISIQYVHLNGISL